MTTNKDMQAISEAQTPPGVGIQTASRLRGNVIRFRPVPTIREELLDEALAIVGGIIRE